MDALWQAIWLLRANLPSMEEMKILLISQTATIFWNHLSFMFGTTQDWRVLFRGTFHTHNIALCMIIALSELLLRLHVLLKSYLSLVGWGAQSHRWLFHYDSYCCLGIVRCFISSFFLSSSHWKSLNTDLQPVSFCSVVFHANSCTDVVFPEIMLQSKVCSFYCPPLSLLCER